MSDTETRPMAASPATAETREIRAFLQERFPLARDLTRLADDDSLLDLGVIDSMGVLELVDFIDERYGIVVRDEELVPENFDSIAGIVAFLHRTRTES